MVDLWRGEGINHFQIRESKIQDADEGAMKLLDAKTEDPIAAIAFGKRLHSLENHPIAAIAFGKRLHSLENHHLHI